MRSDTLKRHMIAKHGHVKSVVQRGEGHQLQRQKLFEAELRADNVNHDRSIENSSAEALNQNLGKKKFILIPETKHLQLMASTTSAAMAIKNRDVLQSIQQPQQREILKRYHLAQNAL